MKFIRIGKHIINPNMITYIEIEKEEVGGEEVDVNFPYAHFTLKREEAVQLIATLGMNKPKENK